MRGALDRSQPTSRSLARTPCRAAVTVVSLVDDPGFTPIYPGLHTPRRPRAPPPATMQRVSASVPLAMVEWVSVGAPDGPHARTTPVNASVNATVYVAKIS